MVTCPSVPCFRHRVADSAKPLKERRPEAPEAGTAVLTLSQPPNSAFQKKFLQTNQSQALSQLKFKDKDTFEFSKHILKEKVIFFYFKKK